ncbi:MAG: isochorismatase family protein [Thermoleophilia bacterium]|nr:isochorismatase family protein [Thermoleophilia bacterium]
MLTDAPDHSALLDRTRSAVLVIDVQDAFASYVSGFDELVQQVALLLRGAAILGVPVAASEQYPQGLGSTVPGVTEAVDDELPSFGKVEFAACSAPGWQQLPAAVRDAEQFVLVGIEAHVCVRHTALALLQAGRDVHVCADAVGSAKPLHRDIAVRGLARAGARETTVEQALFDWLRAAGSDEFRQLQQLLVSNQRATSD